MIEKLRIRSVGTYNDTLLTLSKVTDTPYTTPDAALQTAPLQLHHLQRSGVGLL